MRFIEWHDENDELRVDLAVRWHGGRTFQLRCDGQEVDVRSVDSAVGAGQPPTLAEAYRIAADWLADSIAPADQSEGDWPGLPEERPFGLWVCYRQDHGYHDTDNPCPLGHVPDPETVSWQ